MRINEFPAGRKDDAEIFAAIQNLVPSQSDDKIVLTKKTVSSDFDAEGVFHSSYSRIVSKSVRVRSTTLFRILQKSARTLETRNEIIRRLLIPVIREAIDSTKETADKEKLDLVQYSIAEWAEQSHDRVEELDAGLIKNGYKESLCQPLVCGHREGEGLPQDLKDASHAFLRNLFRLNNIHSKDQFFYAPDIIMKYWNLIATDPGEFNSEISPVLGTMTVCFFKNPICFSLQKSSSEDYYSLVEFLALEKRKPRIASCRIQLRGLTEEDDFIIQEMMGIETELFDDQTQIPFAIGICHDLSDEGLRSFQDDTRRLSGIKASVTFPLISSLAAPGAQPKVPNSLDFNLSLNDDGSRFLFDGVEVREDDLEPLIRVVGRKVFALARFAYRDPARFPQPDLDRMDRDLQETVERAEKEELNEELARDVAVKAAQLDFYESLARVTFALSEEIVRYLEGTQLVTFTIPRVLLAYLHQILEEKNLDLILLEGLEADG